MAQAALDVEAEAAVVKVVEEKADDEVEVEVAELRIDPVLFRLPYGAQRKPV